jgi:hypothetical protein
LFSDRAGRPEDARADRIADDYSETKAHTEYAEQMAVTSHIRQDLQDFS